MVRLGAMGDLIHAIPAAQCLSSLGSLYWAVERRWVPLLSAESRVWETMPVDRRPLTQLVASLRSLRSVAFDLVVDLQGLWKSALITLLAAAPRTFGFHPSQAREPSASVMYTHRFISRSRHIADQYLELAQAAGGTGEPCGFPLPQGEPEGDLPEQPYVLVSPFAGWRGKQWPLDRYADLASRLRAELDLTLALNVAPVNLPATASLAGVHVHVSGLSGLIHVTRGARAVVGLDSGPMHLAAALGVPGIALFGPTDPARNGPLGSSFRVLRDPRAVTTYRHRDATDPGMDRITVDQVMQALREVLK
jgi:heptosyltransferase-1